MSVESKNLTGVGIVVRNQQEVKEYIKNHLSTLNAAEQEALDEADVEDFLKLRRENLEIECLNAFYGEWFFFGFKLCSHNPEEFAQQTLKAAQDWRAMFGEAGKMITEVVIY